MHEHTKSKLNCQPPGRRRLVLEQAFVAGG